VVAWKPVFEKGADQFSWKVDEPQEFAPEDPRPVGAAGHTIATGMVARPEHWLRLEATVTPALLLPILF